MPEALSAEAPRSPEVAPGRLATDHPAALVDAIGKAIHDATAARSGRYHKLRWEDRPEHVQEAYRDDARAALAAIPELPIPAAIVAIVERLEAHPAPITVRVLAEEHLLKARDLVEGRGEAWLRDAEAQKGLVVEFHQWDWIPGFGAFLVDRKPKPESRAFCVVNLGSALGAVAAGDLPPTELPYLIAETMMHEIIHALEKWAGVEFSEDKIEALLERYRQHMAEQSPEGAVGMGGEM